MKKVIRAEEVKSSSFSPNWRGIIDETGDHYQLVDAEQCEEIIQGGLYRLTYDVQKYKRDTKYNKKGDPKNVVTKVEKVPIEGEQAGQGEVAKSKRGATSPLAVVEEKHEVATVQKQPTTVKDQIFPLIPTVGTIKLTEAQEKILFAPVDPQKVEIRPDGLIYLPWMEYVTRLREAFGMGWGIVATEYPRAMGLHILWAFYLLVDGKLMSGPAIGEQRYQPNNPQMTWGDACEGAKSNALMRLCKGLGISLELWQPKFIKGWISKYAEEYETKDRSGKKVKRWRKKK